MNNESSNSSIPRAGIFYVLLILPSLFIVKPNAVNWNDFSRLATVQSLVEQHTFVIDETDFIGTGDKVYINGHFYSDKPVIPSILGAVAYWPLYQSGIELGRGWNLAQYLVVMLVIKTFWLAGLYAFYRCLVFMGAKPGTCIVLSLIFAFCSQFFTWSVTFNNHLVAASCLLLGLMYYLRYQGRGGGHGTLFLSGFFFALAGCVDHAMAVFYIGFFLLLAVHMTAGKKALLAYCLPLCVTVVPVLLINFMISGQLLPFQLVPEYFDYSTHWNGDEALTGSNLNSPLFALEYGYEMFFGRSGFIIYNPLLIIGIPYLFLEIYRQRKYRPEALVIVACCLVIMLYYIMTSNNFSGWSYSIRWFVPLLPFLLLFIYRFLDDPPNLQIKRAFIPLCILSLVISGVGAVNPWASQLYTKHPFLANTVYFFDLN